MMGALVPVIVAWRASAFRTRIGLFILRGWRILHAGMGRPGWSGHVLIDHHGDDFNRLASHPVPA